MYKPVNKGYVSLKVLFFIIFDFFLVWVLRGEQAHCSLDEYTKAYSTEGH